MVDFAFQSSKYNKFISNREKVMGKGPTQKKQNEREWAEERRFVDQFCDVILHGDLLEEMEDPNEKDFMPSVCAKHRAPRNMDIGIQEHPTKKKQQDKQNKWGKELPNRVGKGFNPCYNNYLKQTRTSHINRQNENDYVIVPEAVEKEFMKANKIYYVVLKKGQETSTKQIVKCQGCDRAITLDDKRFPNNMVFKFKTYHHVPASDRVWVMSWDKQNRYFHAHDMTCIHQIHELNNACISDVYMDNGSFKDLKPENVRQLEVRGHYEAVVEIREKLARDEHLLILSIICIYIHMFGNN